MTDGVLIVGNVIRGGCKITLVEPNEPHVIKDNIFSRGNIIRSAGDPDVDPSAGEDQGE